MEKLDNTDNKDKIETNQEEKIENSKEEVDEMMKQIGDMMYNNNNVKKGEQHKDTYKFWDTQPVPKFNSEIENEGPLDNKNDLEAVRKEPYNLPKNFNWHDIDIKNKKELKQLYEFLRDNYVEDDDHMFRFDYSPEFLQWHLTAPGYLKQWHCSVFKTLEDGSKIMVGFISGIPLHVFISGKEVKKVEINFLCVHAKYRTNRVAPVLIKEITRRVNLQNIWQAAYTSGTLLPKPISVGNYYHRNLNLKKLLDVKFTYLRPNLNLARASKIFKVSNETTIQGIREMTKKDVEGVYVILEKYLSKFKVRPYYSKEDVEHWFVPRKNIVYSYVIENDKGVITDFISFYLLPSSILKHDTHKILYAAYSFYNVPGEYTIKELIKNALILAKQQKFDVYNALNVMENESVFNDLLFGRGDGSLKYYFYNYACPEVEPKDLALVFM